MAIIFLPCQGNNSQTDCVPFSTRFYLRIEILFLTPVPVKTPILLIDKFFEYYQGGAGQPAAICLQQAQSYIRNITRAELLSIEQGRIILAEIDAKIDHLQGAEHPLQHPIFWGAWLCQG
jgi:hypothetical protein